MHPRPLSRWGRGDREAVGEGPKVGAGFLMRSIATGKLTAFQASQAL